MKNLFILVISLFFLTMGLTGCDDTTEDSNCIANDVVAESAAACMQTSEDGEWDGNKTGDEITIEEGIKIKFAASTVNSANLEITYTDYELNDTTLTGTLDIEISTVIENGQIKISGVINGQVKLEGDENGYLTFENAEFSAIIKLTPASITIGLDASAVTELTVTGYSFSETETETETETE